MSLQDADKQLAECICQKINLNTHCCYRIKSHTSLLASLRQKTQFHYQAVYLQSSINIILHLYGKHQVHVT